METTENKPKKTCPWDKITTAQKPVISFAEIMKEEEARKEEERKNRRNCKSIVI